MQDHIESDLDHPVEASGLISPDDAANLREGMRRTLFIHATSAL